VKEFIIRRYRPDSSPTAERSTVLRIDDEGRILFADHHAEAILGYDSGELEGQSVHRILASREDDPFAPANRHRIERGQTVLVTFRHKEGFFYTASLNLRLEMRDADNAARQIGCGPDGRHESHSIRRRIADQVDGDAIDPGLNGATRADDRLDLIGEDALHARLGHRPRFRRSDGRVEVR